MDDLDRRILSHLQRDGRMTNLELSRLVHLSPAATLERVRKLEQSNAILGYMARLNPESLNLGLLVFIQVTLDRSSPDLFEMFSRTVRDIPQVTECHMVAGGFDYLLKARVRDMNAYRLFLGRTLTRLPGVRQTHTYTVMEQVKAESALPLPGLNT
ncbi:Lrp/AsnC ligand binding domain-containing protein [Komagataeibacter sp. FNDCF1]|uniref:Lrp/AsnC ligand binding domain-containing protein n=1 Tax=Komagataeibacter sp. FNDCF1 TaxID=2878681 RepID=UPI001E5395D9|nr:Lrp/AsnC ligand binding domain-containing protein [Komagataeibacter sp. FNDCF1]MCE2563587.1 Lrp/AsnC ligand binding domain-containing protein [Komagataeibacter sp. FNDCF1]